jgi:hypothetical protein
MSILLKVRHVLFASPVALLDIFFASLVALLGLAAIAAFLTAVGVGAYFLTLALLYWGVLT